MTPERWQLLKDIFTRALEQPTELRETFVREASGEDTELLAEIRRLLEEHDRQDSNLSRPALEAERFSDDAPPQFLPETLLAGRFRIVRYIARGGMGEVYEAEDLVLRERVALKTIRPEIAQDEHVLEMFKTEIQLARKVTHPNVCRIHDFAQHVEQLTSGGERTTSFLTMELLEGETLARHLNAREPLSMEQALPLIEQLAAALEAAHSVGVIHRDLKPGNVMVMARQEDKGLRVVVTDFGMAILAREAVADHAPPVRGTPRYMAPEQIQNGPVTPATDVYSLALVIAEMIGARHRTAASSRIKTLLGLPPSKYTAPKLSIPTSCAGWSTILQKCLAYEPDRRYRGPAEVLEALRAVLDSGSSRRRNLGLIFGLVAAVLLAAVVVQQWPRLRDQPTTPINRSLFTEDDKLQVWGASPDASLLAATAWEAAGAGGNLVVREVQTGKTRQLTQKPGSDYFGALDAIFSPDGKWIAYHWDEDVESELRMVSTDGVNTRTIHKDPVLSVTPQDWSPDGRRILADFRGGDGSVQIGMISLDDGSVTLVGNQGRWLSRPRFSADGNSIFVNTLQPGDDIASDIYRLSLDGAELARPVENPADDTLIDLSPDRTRLIFTSDRQGTLDLWSAPVEPGSSPVTRLWPNLGRIQPFNITRSGAFFYRLEPQVQEVYTAALDIGSGQTISAPKRVIERFKGPSLWPGWSPDGRQLLLNYQLGLEEPTLAIHTPATKSTRILRVHLVRFQRPQWHPSGKWIDVVGRDREGRNGHFRVDPVSGDASLLISSQALESGFEGVWSRDGMTIFNRFTEWRQGIFRFRLDTRARRVLYVPPKGTDISQENLALSPDGRWLAFHARQKAAGASFLMVVPSEGGEANPLLTISSPEEFVMGSFAWTPDSKTLLAVRTTNKGAYSESSQLWKIPIDGSAPARIDYPEMRMAQMRLSPDGQTIAFTSGRATSEIFVLERLPQSTR